MRIVRKWIRERESSFILGKKKKNRIAPGRDVEIELDPRISSNLQILNNQTKIIAEKEQLVDSMKSLPNTYHDGNCVCLFIMLVFYYLSIICTKLKNTLEESINRKN